MDRIVIVLGCGNDDRGKLSPTAIERLEEGIREYGEHPGSAILPTGGFGAHFNTSPRPHAAYAREYLVGRGVPAADILPLAESGNTVEDAILSQPRVAAEPGAAVTVVTSDYHLERARFVFSRILAGRELVFRPARSALPAEKLATLRAHEEAALERMSREGIEYGGIFY